MEGLQGYNQQGKVNTPSKGNNGGRKWMRLARKDGVRRVIMWEILPRKKGEEGGHQQGGHSFREENYPKC